MCLQCRRPEFDPWVGKMPWRRKWQPTPCILAWRIPWTEEPGGPRHGVAESNVTERLTHTHTWIGYDFSSPFFSPNFKLCFISACSGSLLLRVGILQRWWVGAALRCRAHASLLAGAHLRWSTDSKHGFSSCGTWLSRSLVHGVFLHQGSNPRPLHWWADSQPRATRAVLSWFWRQCTREAGGALTGFPFSSTQQEDHSIIRIY